MWAAEVLRAGRLVFFAAGADGTNQRWVGVGVGSGGFGFTGSFTHPPSEAFRSFHAAPDSRLAWLRRTLPPLKRLLGGHLKLRPPARVPPRVRLPQPDKARLSHTHTHTRPFSVLQTFRDVQRLSGRATGTRPRPPLTRPPVQPGGWDPGLGGAVAPGGPGLMQ